MTSRTSQKSRRAAHGKPCAYCERTMQLGHIKLNPTNDHVHPESKGGREIVIACIQCNMIKADMLPAQWEAFMAATPEWWKLTKHDIRRARHALNLLTPGLTARMNARRERAAAGLTRSGKPKPVVVPPELIYANTLRPYERSQFLLQAHRDAMAQAAQAPTPATPEPEGLTAGTAETDIG